MKNNKKVIAVISPKGGVGKTSTTANLALALSNTFNKKVLAIDTNITIASLGLHFNILYPHVTISDITRNNFPVSKIVVTYNNNLDIIPASVSIEKQDKNFKKLEGNIKEVTENYSRILAKEFIEPYDVVLLDSAPGFSIELIASLNIAGSVIIVANPDYPSIVSATKTILYAQMLKVPIEGIVLTKVTGEKYELTAKEIEKALGVPVIKEIPFDKRIPESIANKIPLVQFDKKSPASIAYTELAASLIGETYSHSLFGRIKRFLKINNL